jgi:hypothetical protein
VRCLGPIPLFHAARRARDAPAWHWLIWLYLPLRKYRPNLHAKADRRRGRLVKELPSTSVGYGRTVLVVDEIGILLIIPGAERDAVLPHHGGCVRLPADDAASVEFL